MNDLERRLEEMFMSDSRGRRVGQVNVASRRPNYMRSLTFIGGVAALALAAAVALNVLRPAGDVSPAANPSASASPIAASAPAGGVVRCGDVSSFSAPSASADGLFILTSIDHAIVSRVRIPAGTQIASIGGYVCVAVVPESDGSRFAGLVARDTPVYINDPRLAPSGAAIKPDSTHGVITFQNIRTEADPRDLQQPPEFTRDGRSSDFNVGVSPDGTRVAMLRYGQTGTQLITFTTARPKDITVVLDFSGSGETAGSVIWAGDGANSVLIVVSKVATSSGPEPTFTYSTLRVVDLGTKQVTELLRISNGDYLMPLAWRLDMNLAAAAEVGAGGRVGNYIYRWGGGTTFFTLPPNVFSTGITASRDGKRIVAVTDPTVRWWPTEQPTAAKELTADSRGRAEYAAFRPGTDELGVNVSAPTASAGVPPPGHLEIWNVTTGAQRVVTPLYGFQFWRVDGSAALQGTNLIDPQTGAVTQLPGGPIKIVDVVRFTEPVAVPPPTSAAASPVPPPTGAQSPASQVSLNGRSFRIGDAYLWRDFMPISEPGGKPLAASIKIQVDSGTFPTDVTVDHVWVYGPTTWEPMNVEIRRSPDAGTPANQIEVFANGGPKWDPGSEVSVDVRLVSGSTTRILRVTEVTIQKTS